MMGSGTDTSEDYCGSGTDTSEVYSGSGTDTSEVYTSETYIDYSPYFDKVIFNQQIFIGLFVALVTLSK